LASLDREAGVVAPLSQCKPDGYLLSRPPVTTLALHSEVRPTWPCTLFGLNGCPKRPAQGAKHGYAMIEDIKATTGIELGAGTLYGALSRLEYNSFVEPLPAEERRRPYRLTEAGAVALRAQLASMGALSTMGLHRLATS